MWGSAFKKKKEIRKVVWKLQILWDEMIFVKALGKTLEWNEEKLLLFLLGLSLQGRKRGERNNVLRQNFPGFFVAHCASVIHECYMITEFSGEMHLENTGLDQVKPVSLQ